MIPATMQLRHALHAHPELSGSEHATARRLQRFFSDVRGVEFVEGLGGAGLAVIFHGTRPGGTVMLRSELDALPIAETTELPYRSSNHGVSHKCGHDGHMAILAEVGRRLAIRPLAVGRLILLFQPAEETGKGAAAVLADRRFDEIAPDRIYALHNLPGYPLGQIVTRAGPFSCASRGLRIWLQGLEAHAAQPETGVSPSRALCALIEMLNKLPGTAAMPGETAFATVVHANMGVRSFGIAPGSAEIMATLRSEREDTMNNMLARVRETLGGVCADVGLEYTIGFEDVFPATCNDTQAFEEVCIAAQGAELKIAEKPFRWSEDFGFFTARYPGAMFGLGAGLKTPALHHPQYDFPDGLIERGAAIFLRLAENFLHKAAAL